MSAIIFASIIKLAALALLSALLDLKLMRAPEFRKKIHMMLNKSTNKAIF